MDIEVIKARLRTNKYELTFHAKKRMGEREIKWEEVENVILNGKIIEEYPEDKPYPSCLILGYVKEKIPLYVQCAVSPELVHIITVHWLDPEKWFDPETRRERRKE